MSLFEYKVNIVVAVLVFTIGFCGLWMGQLISVLNWDLATRIGLQEKGMPEEYKVYEHGLAVADSTLVFTAPDSRSNMDAGFFRPLAR